MRNRKILNLNELSNINWQELASKKSTIVKQGNDKFVIIIPSSIDIDNDKVTVDDLIVILL